MIAARTEKSCLLRVLGAVELLVLHSDLTCNAGGLFGLLDDALPEKAEMLLLSQR